MYISIMYTLLFSFIVTNIFPAEGGDRNIYKKSHDAK